MLDSYGIPADRLAQGDCGGIYGVAKPPVNVCKAPTVWQSYDITFQHRSAWAANSQNLR